MEATAAWRTGLDKSESPLAAVSGIYPKPAPAVPLSDGTNRHKESDLLLKIHRIAHWLWKRNIPLLPRLLSLFNRLVFATQLPAQTRIGRGVRLSYSGLGTVIHARAVIGDHVEIGPGVVIGGRSQIHEVPVIEDFVQIGVGAKVLGPVHVGRQSLVAGCELVLHDVPPGAVVGGVPARRLRKRAVVSDTAGRGLKHTGT